MNCYPESQPSYKHMTEYKPEHTGRQIKCTCDYLKKYVDFATELRKSDKDVNELFEATKYLIPFSIQSQSTRIKNEINTRLTEEGKLESDIEGAVKAIQFDIRIIGKLLDILLDSERAKLRLDKVLIIERYIDTAHNDAPLIGEACAEKEINGDRFLNIYTSDVTQETLDCLARKR